MPEDQFWEEGTPARLVSLFDSYFGARSRKRREAERPPTLYSYITGR